MGFLDKVKGLAVTAKDELDKSGLLEHLGSDTAAPPAGAETDPGSATRMVDAIRRGAVDPLTLISAEEVAEIAGHEVTLRRSSGPYQQDGVIFESTCVFISFESRDETHTLSVQHNEDDSRPWDAEATYQEIEWADPEGLAEMTGLGERCCALWDHVWVLQSGHVLSATASGNDVDTARARQQATEMLRLAITRL